MANNVSRIGAAIVAANENTAATNPYANPQLRGKQAKRLEEISKKMNEGSLVDMLSQPEPVEGTRVYDGRIFSVDDRRVMLQETENRSEIIGRQVVRHPLAAIMLVHNTADDTYLVEREYRAGSNTYAFGIPAGLVDPHESALMAAFRELREETGIVVDGVPSGTDAEKKDGSWTAENVEKSAGHSAGVMVEDIGSFYSSEGMSDEVGTIFALHLSKFSRTDRQFDFDEHVQSAWVSWDDMEHILPFRGAVTIIALQHEQIRRMREGLEK